MGRRRATPVPRRIPGAEAGLESDPLERGAGVGSR